MNKQGSRPPKALKTPGKGFRDNPTAPWMLLALALFAAIVYLLYNDQDKAIAEMDGQRLMRADLSEEAALDVQTAENFYYSALERRANEWASKIALEKEVRRTGRTVQQILEDIGSTIEVSEADVWERLRSAPASDRRPFPGVLDEIRRALRAEKEDSVRRSFLVDLVSAENFKISAPKPSSYKPQPRVFLYPVYSPPASEDRAGGRVVGPPSRGSMASDAVVLEIYSDFMCPFSKRFAETMRTLEAKYPDRLRVVFRHFPLPMHVGAEILAEAAVCAQEQGKFWPMHDALMAWEGPPQTEKLAAAAQGAGMDAQAFSGCLTDGRYKNYVKREVENGRQRGVDSTPVFLLNGRKANGALPAEKIYPLIEWFESQARAEYPGKVYDPPPQPPQGNAAPAPPADLKPAEFPEDWLLLGPARGPANASVTIIELNDFHCPFCQKGAQAIDAMIKDSKTPIRLLSKQYPLPMHPNAQNAAVAALCAGKQEKYWEYRDELFGGSWGKQTPDDLKAAASKVGVSREKFDACLDASETLEQVRKDVSIASASGVSGTPTYFINGMRVVGANPPAIQKLIDEVAAPPKK